MGMKVPSCSTKQTTCPFLTWAPCRRPSTVSSCSASADQSVNAGNTFALCTHERKRARKGGGGASQLCT